MQAGHDLWQLCASGIVVSKRVLSAATAGVCPSGRMGLTGILTKVPIPREISFPKRWQASLTQRKAGAEPLPLRFAIAAERVTLPAIDSKFAQRLTIPLSQPAKPLPEW
jgi:hypothetical protein